MNSAFGSKTARSGRPHQTGRTQKIRGEQEVSTMYDTFGWLTTSGRKKGIAGRNSGGPNNQMRHALVDSISLANNELVSPHAIR